MKRALLILFVLAGISSHRLSAQGSQAEAVLHPDSMRIGQQIELEFRLRYHEGMSKATVQWPEFSDTIMYGVEIMKLDSIRTTLVDRASVMYEQKRSMTITCFDEGVYELPPQQFIVNSDTVYSNAILLFVKTVPVDTTRPIKDIKPIFEVPGPPKDADDSGFNWWLLAGGLVLIAAMIGFVVWLSRRKKVAPPVIAKEPARIKLPHERFLEELAELESRQQWMKGELRQYHMALTDIMRGWLVERYRIHAREMTTFEIIRALRKQNVPQGPLLQIERVLRTADMVKFAKGIPEREENEHVMKLSVNFIQQTAVYPAALPVNPYPQA